MALCLLAGCSRDEPQALRVDGGDPVRGKAPHWYWFISALPRTGSPPSTRSACGSSREHPASRQSAMQSA
ncbi:MAG: hypothetical protein EON47_23540, partial [Acetobacteraceae bacterium]